MNFFKKYWAIASGQLRRKEKIALSYKNQENFSKAIECYREILQYKPDDAITKRLLAECEELHAQKTEAEHHLTQGNVYFNEGLYNKALKEYTTARELYALAAVPQKIETTKQKISYRNQLHTALTAEKKGDYKRAISAYQRCLKTFFTPEVHERLGICYIKNRQFREAMPYFENGDFVNPTEANYYYGQALLHGGSAKAAIHCFESLDSPEMLQFVSEYRKWMSAQEMKQVQHILKQCFEQKNYAAARKALLQLTDGDPFLEESILRYLKDTLLPYLNHKIVSQEIEKGDYQNALKVIGATSLPLHQTAVLHIIAFSQTPQYAKQGIALWISALYNCELHNFLHQHPLSRESRFDGEKIREGLLRLLTQKVDDLYHQKKIKPAGLAFLQFELQHTRSLAALNTDVNLVLSPYLAEQQKKSATILQALDRHKKADERVLSTGAAYSSAAEAFRHICRNAPEKAAENLGEANDRYAEYVHKRYHLGILLQKLEREETDIRDHIFHARSLFTLNPEYKTRVIAALEAMITKLDEAKDEETAVELAKCAVEVGGLTELKRLWSLAFSHFVIRQSNEEIISETAALQQLDKALKIDPNNDHAKRNKEIINDNIAFKRDFDRIQAAVDSENYSHAAQIAAGSSSQVIKDKTVDFFINRLNSYIDSYNQLPYYERISQYELFQRFICPNVRYIATILGDYHEFTQNLKRKYNC